MGRKRQAPLLKRARAWLGSNRRHRLAASVLSRVAPVSRPLADLLAYGALRPREVRTFRQDRSSIEQSGLFDANWYAACYPKVAASSLNPLYHLLLCGRQTHNPHPLFDTAWYLQRYSDVAERGDIPLCDYLRHGMESERGRKKYIDHGFHGEHG